MNFRMETIFTPNQKSHIVRSILTELPEWFCLADGIQPYINEATDLPMWAMREEKSREYVGFVTLKETSLYAGEIHCMGVSKAFHRKGIGKSLFNAVLDDIKSKYKLLQVKTVAEGRCDVYDRTIAFYRSLGFIDLEVFPEIGSSLNPCLILVYMI